jgi:membrane protease YdiL (CAAX protease family)
MPEAEPAGIELDGSRPPDARSVATVVVTSVAMVFAWFLAAAVAEALPRWLAALWIVALGGAVLWVHRADWRTGSRRAGESTAARVRPGRTLSWVVLAIPPVLLTSMCVTRLCLQRAGNPDIEPMFLKEAFGKGHGAAAVLLTVAFGPLIEELMFRGRIQPALVARLGPRIGIAATAAIFAIIHFSRWTIPPLLLAGVLYGAAVHLSRSIWAGVILHAATNAASVAMSAGGNFGLDELGPFDGGAQLVLLAGAVLGWACLTAIARRVQRLAAPALCVGPAAARNR